jgi:hypothetical protein
MASLGHCLAGPAYLADFFNYQNFSVPSMDREYLEQSTTCKILAIATVFPILALMMVLLRLCTRLLVIRIASRDDFFITLAVVGHSITIGTGPRFCHFSLGLLLWDFNYDFIQ